MSLAAEQLQNVLNRKRSSSRRPDFSLFIHLALEILFLLNEENPRIKGLNIFDHCYLYSAYADDATSFLQDVNSIKELVDSFHIFSHFSGLRPNFKKCEIVGIGVLKRVKVAVCGIYNV